MPLLRNALQKFVPHAMMVHSKGISIACELARLGIWSGRTFISAPIINPSQALKEDDYESMAVLLNTSTKVAFAIGIDEAEIIMEGGLQDVAAKYGWPVHMFHGGHWWYENALNAVRTSKILNDFILTRRRHSSEALEFDK